MNACCGVVRLNSPPKLEKPKHPVSAPKALSATLLKSQTLGQPERLRRPYQNYPERHYLSVRTALGLCEAHALSVR